MNKFQKITSTLMALSLGLSSFVACGGIEDPFGGGVKVDNTKTQLYVYSYNGGYGQEWLYDVRDRFEKEYENYEGINGKVGVQIVLDEYSKTLGTSFFQNMGNNEIYFTEEVFYYNFVSKGKILDLTTALTTPLEEFGEEKSVFDKLTSAEQNFYLTEDDKIYAVPYRFDTEGIVYDVELFDTESLYFAKGGVPSEFSKFTQKNNPNKVEGSFNGELKFENCSFTNLKGERSAGPDGLYGTDDDGLPATYDEFFVLCDKMLNKGITPFNWSGNARVGYLHHLYQQLIVDYEGATGFETYMTYNGTANNLIKSIDAEGNIEFEEPTTISYEAGNGYLMSKSAGRYYALSFLERLIKNAAYYSQKAFNGNYMHTIAQEDYLESKYKKTRYAFFIDGIWWENEASYTFEEMGSIDENDSRLNRQFKLLQLPKATTNDIGEVATYANNMHSLCFVNAKIAREKVKLANAFVRFCFSDESNVNFNLLTGCPRVMGYTLNDAQRAELSMFGNQIYDLTRKSAITFAYANHDIYKMYCNSTTARLTWGGSLKMTETSIADSFKYNNDTAYTIFNASKNALQSDVGSNFGK